MGIGAWICCSREAKAELYAGKSVVSGGTPMGNRGENPSGADNQQGRNKKESMKYRLGYNLVGNEEAYSLSAEFEASNDGEAATQAGEFVRELRRQHEEKIPNPFHRPDIEVTGLVRVEQEEVATKVAAPVM